jgi:hypothetical protein
MPTPPGSDSEVARWFERARHWLSWLDDKSAKLPAALTATKAWNPGNVAFGASLSTTVSVPGARMGDPVVVGFTDEEAGILFTGQVKSPGVVRAVLTNASEAGIAFDMNAGTLTVVVFQVGL